MTGRSTSWFDRDELKALFKGVRPARATEPAGATEESVKAPPGGLRAPLLEPAPEPRLEAPIPALAPPAEVPAAPEERTAPGTLEASDRESDLPPVPWPPAESRPQETVDPAPAPPSRDEPSPLEEEDALPPSAPEPAPSPVREAPPERVVAAPAAPDPATEALWRQSEALLDLARGQAATQALEDRLWELTETAASVLSLARASVWTFDEERTRLTCADFFSAIRDGHESGQTQSARDYPLYFAALHSERPIVAHDARADPRTRELLGGGPSVGQARIEAPVFVAGRLAGVLRLEHEGSPRRFEHHEERFASSLADLTGIALEAQERRLKEAVARVGEERVRAQRDALAELTRGDSLARGQIEGLLQEVTEAAVRVMRVERASVWVYAPDYKSLFCLDAFDRAAARHDRGAEITEEAAPAYFEALRAGGPIVTTDARADLRLADLVESGVIPAGVSARLEAPVHLVGRLAGGLWCERTGVPRAWLADEERFAEALAGFVALSIATSERRRSDNELRRVLEDMDRPVPRPPGMGEKGRTSEGFDEDLGDA